MFETHLQPTPYSLKVRCHLFEMHYTSIHKCNTAQRNWHCSVDIALKFHLTLVGSWTRTSFVCLQSQVLDRVGAGSPP